MEKDNDLHVVWIDTNCGESTQDWEINSSEKPFREAQEEAQLCNKNGFPTKILRPGETPRSDGFFSNPETDEIGPDNPVNFFYKVGSYGEWPEGEYCEHQSPGYPLYRTCEGRNYKEVLAWFKDNKDANTLANVLNNINAPMHLDWMLKEKQ